jgi:hypothetical protein
VSSLSCSLPLRSSFNQPSLFLIKLQGNKTPDEIDNDKHRAMSEHEREEQRADALASESNCL